MQVARDSDAIIFDLLHRRPNELVQDSSILRGVEGVVVEKVAQHTTFAHQESKLDWYSNLSNVLL